MAVLPAVHAFVKESNGEFKLVLSNYGAIPAYDLDFIALSYYFEDDMPVDVFLRSYLKKPQYFAGLKASPHGEYAVFDHGVNAVLPPRTRLTIVLPTVHRPDGLHLLLQYRDVAGRNYGQVFWFSHPQRVEKSDRLSLGSLRPKTPRAIPRMAYDKSLETEDGSALPEEFAEFDSIFECAVSIGVLREELGEVEDRGVIGALT